MREDPDGSAEGLLPRGRVVVDGAQEALVFRAQALREGRPSGGVDGPDTPALAPVDVPALATDEIGRLREGEGEVMDVARDGALAGPEGP